MIPSRRVRILVAVLLMLYHRHAAGQLPGPPTAGRVVVETSGLVQPSEIVYAGSFRCPSSSAGSGPTCAYGGQALGFNSAANSLFISGHDTSVPLLAAEITIPPVPVVVSINTPHGSSLINTLPRAAIRQPFADPLDGKANLIGASTTNSYKLGGLLPWGQRLVTTAYLFYDANGVQQVTHFDSGQQLSVATDANVYKLGTVPPFGPGFVSGYMTPIPQEWQAQLGGPVLTGYCCLSIISRTSLGPSISVFDPANLGVVNPAPVTTLLGYPLRSTLMPPGYTEPLGNCQSTGTPFNCAVVVGGVVFPKNSRSVLFIGRLGTGPSCYGGGVPTFPLGLNECFDPSETAKGYHAYPYNYHVWAYDVLDLIAVKQGQKLPWQVMPYKMWTFDLPFAFASKIIKGVAYDSATSKVFLVQADGDQYGMPLIHEMSIVH